MLTKRAHCIIRQNPFSVLASVIMSDTQQDREDRLLHTGEIQGFSLIELLVVVAIIGVVTVVGIAGYQTYIENTRADVAKNNAQSVERWLSYAHIARSGGLTVDPAECGTDQMAGLKIALMIWQVMPNRLTNSKIPISLPAQLTLFLFIWIMKHPLLTQKTIAHP